ncbi:SDR family NAD(P)-dependent oxidoreductase [Nocardioides ferulae]|uniref:SDR family NAD(P)-dependent oxidoreductase n=1 Tax=Nocardioides ferulae TaxID=2340821 RepID=UPI000EAD8DD8|nr:SDR family NAD(P)-dependent oxidoreductase [Nocardioides ferulae]
MKIDGSVWVVTGAGNGMGRELTLQLLRRGARVAAVDLGGDALAETAALAGAGERLSTHVLDITDRDGVDALPRAVLTAHGAVDGLLNNAGIIQPFVPVAELDDAAIRRVMDVNFSGTLQLTRAFLPLLLERPEAHIANVSSMGGFFPFPGQTIYGASKAAVKLLTEGLYAELLDTHVRVSVIMPGAVNTAITAHSGVAGPAGMGDAEGSKVPMTSADKAARIMLDGIEKNRLHIYVGLDALLMSVAIKVAPRRAVSLVKKAMDKRQQTSPTPTG